MPEGSDTFASKVESLANVVAARWRWKSRQVAIDSVSAERTLAATTGLLAGKDENDPFISINLEIPFLLR
ncbi:MAG: hypothetical protein VX679_06615, partial [Pseudomonadota bacterium]|nr:hypothetical protein [Pseudomonadota bacterium]